MIRVGFFCNSFWTFEYTRGNFEFGHSFSYGLMKWLKNSWAVANSLISGVKILIQFWMNKDCAYQNHSLIGGLIMFHVRIYSTKADPIRWCRSFFGADTLQAAKPPFWTCLIFKNKRLFHWMYKNQMSFVTKDGNGKCVQMLLQQPP